MFAVAVVDRTPGEHEHSTQIQWIEVCRYPEADRPITDYLWDIKPNLQPGEALIRIHYAGICNTDLELERGYMNFHGVMGHEFVGTVVQVSEEIEATNTDFFLNQRVCGEINLPCKSCSICTCHPKTKKQTILARNHCPQRTVLGILNKQGSMAQYLTLPISNLHLVPSRIPDRIAVFAEPLAAALRIVEQNIIHFPHSSLAILGDGKLGLMIANVVGRIYLQHILNEYFPTLKNSTDSTTMDEIQATLKELSTKQAWIQKQKPILFGKHAQKMNLLKDPLVYDDTEPNGSLVQCVSLSDCIDETSWNGVSPKYSSHFDVVIDATGSPSGLSLAAKLCKPMGTLVLKSTCATGTSFNTAPFVIDELHIVGSRCGPMDQSLDFLNTFYEDENVSQEEEELNPANLLRKLAPFYVDRLIHGIFPLKDAINAFRFASEKETLKVILDCSVQEDNNIEDVK